LLDHSPAAGRIAQGDAIAASKLPSRSWNM
jgi:hypothetical protein